MVWSGLNSLGPVALVLPLTPVISYHGFERVRRNESRPGALSVKFHRCLEFSKSEECVSGGGASEREHPSPLLSRETL